MKRRHIPNYIRATRQRAALSQKQLGILLGFRTPNDVCRFERTARLPKLRTALALELIFGVPLKKLFHGLYDTVEEQVMARAYRLYQSVEHRTDPAGRRKAEMLREILARATWRIKRDL